MTKEKRKKILTIIAVLFIALLLISIISDSGILENLFSGNGDGDRETEKIVLCDPNFDENIFEDPEYMEKERYVLFYNGIESVLLSNEAAYNVAGPTSVLFGDYFNALINGDSEAYNKCFSGAYLSKHGEKGAFTMQKLYDIEVELQSEEILDQNTYEERVVSKYIVYYRIMDNNGTFRDDIPSDTNRPQIYEVINKKASGSILINSITDVTVNYK